MMAEMKIEYRSLVRISLGKRSFGMYWKIKN
jgi:hypothetical protein